MVERFQTSLTVIVIILGAITVFGCAGSKGSDSICPTMADFYATPLEGTVPLTVQFKNNSIGNYSLCSWDFGDATPGVAETNPIYSYTNAGLYTVTLTLLSGTVVIASEVKQAYITVNDTGPSANFTAAPRSGPAPLGVQFTNTSQGNTLSYFWSFGDGQTSTDEEPDHIYYAQGIYDVTLTVSGPEGPDTEMKFGYIAVGCPPPVADFTAYPTFGATPMRVWFTSTSTGDITDYLWEFGDGLTSTERSPDHYYTGLNGTKYTVKLTVYGPGGEDTKTKVDHIWLGP